MMGTDMLSVTETRQILPFIIRAYAGFVTGQPLVRFCRINFAAQHYQDALFEQFHIGLPHHLRQAAVKRRSEYLAGRCCAAHLLTRLGQPTEVSTADRAPVWPESVCGSLSHSGEWAIALLAPAGKGFRPGVDIEYYRPEVLLETAEVFTLTAEREYLKQLDMPWPLALLVAFSAKEGLYKSLYPQVQRYFGFASASLVALDPQRQVFCLRLNETLADGLPQGMECRGCYTFSNGYVTTLLF